MSALIVKNLLIVFLTLSVLLTLGYLLFFKFGTFILDKMILVVERFSKVIIDKLASKIKSKYRILWIEVLVAFLIVTITYVISVNWMFSILLLPFLFVCMLSGHIIAYFQSQRLPYISLIEWVTIKNNDKYIINRTYLILKEFLGSYSLWVAIYISYSIFLALKWPDSGYFIMFLIIPFEVNIWIYFKFGKGLRETESINIRRIIIYFGVVIVVLGDSYCKYKVFFNLEQQSFFDFWLSISALLFIALERLLKAFADDFNSFKTKNKA